MAFDPLVVPIKDAFLKERVNELSALAHGLAAAAFPTVAELVADTTLAYGTGPQRVAEGEVVEAGGFRYEVAASSASDQHVTTAGGVKLYVLPGASGFVTPQQSGAAADGVTDDAAILRACFAFAGARGTSVRVPRGTYQIGSTVSWDITQGFEIECEVGAVFRASASLPQDSKLFQPSASSGPVRFAWRGGQIDGRLMPARATGAPDLLYIAGSNIKGVSIEDVHFLCNDTRAGTAGDSALFLAEGEDYSVTGCTFQGATDAGIYMSGNTTETLGRRVVATGNTFKECGVGFISKRKFQDHIVNDNMVVNCTSGLVIGGEADTTKLPGIKAVISGNVLRGCLRGIEARIADGTIITGNRVEDFGVNAAGTAVADAGIIVQGSDNCLVSGNYLAIVTGTPDPGTAGIRIGPRTYNAVTYESQYTLVEGNVIFGVPRGIEELASSNNTVVGPNVIIGATSNALSLTGALSQFGVPMPNSTPYGIGNPGEPSLVVNALAGAVSYVTVVGSTSSTPTISTGGSAASVNLVIDPKGTGVVLVGGGIGSEALRIGQGVTSGNALEVSGGAAGAAPQLIARGTDTNIDLRLTPKGTGAVRFGTHTVSADAPVSGYIEMRDAGGTVRKLAVIT